MRVPFLLFFPAIAGSSPFLVIGHRNPGIDLPAHPPHYASFLRVKLGASPLLSQGNRENLFFFFTDGSTKSGSLLEGFGVFLPPSSSPFVSPSIVFFQMSCLLQRVRPAVSR